MAPKARKWHLPPSERRRLLHGLLFVSPWLLGFMMWTLYPLGASLYYSFTRYDLLRPPVFIGLRNFQELFLTDREFRVVVPNTLYYVVLGTPLSVATAFLMANLLNTRIIGRSAFRTIFYFPSIVPATVVAMVWGYLLNPQFGAINSTLRALGLKVIPFLSSPALAKPTLILIGMWASGYYMVLFLATLQDVPRELHEAAKVDGANALSRFWHITTPFCTPVILFNLVTGFIYGFQDFTMPWLLTGGGPNQSTNFYALHLFRNAFQYLRMGKASAMAWLLFGFVVLLTFVLFRSSARFVYYADAD
ncbi:MAG: carbohydrate ABC transporter permease [Anaerolineae bacterium]